MTATEALRDDGSDSDYRHNLLEAAVSQVSEHFDSVVIIATAHGSKENTHFFTTGRGNLYANVAAAEKYAYKVRKITNKKF